MLLYLFTIFKLYSLTSYTVYRLYIDHHALISALANTKIHINPLEPLLHDLLHDYYIIQQMSKTKPKQL